MADDVYNKGLVGRALPPIADQNSWANFRTTRYGEQYAQSTGTWRHAMSDEGTYFVCRNNTTDVATTLAGHPAPVLVDADVTMTKPLIHMMMGSTSTRAYLDYIEIEVITAGAAGTSDHWAMQLDTGATRYSSGTVETFTSYSSNMQSTAAAGLTVKGGPFVAGAENAGVRRIGHGTFKNTIELDGDKYIFQFGGDPIAANKVSAAASVFQVTCPPVVLGFGDQLLLALWQVAQSSAGVYKVRCGWWEK